MVACVHLFDAPVRLPPAHAAVTGRAPHRLLTLTHASPLCSLPCSVHSPRADGRLFFTLASRVTPQLVLAVILVATSTFQYNLPESMLRRIDQESDEESVALTTDTSVVCEDHRGAIGRSVKG
eukprot:5864710-Pleurochrysis_carterae.AAC.1